MAMSPTNRKNRISITGESLAYLSETVFRSSRSATIDSPFQSGSMGRVSSLLDSFVKKRLTETEEEISSMNHDDEMESIGYLQITGN